MFLDGLIYATLGRNLAEGLGSFWQPFYTDAFGPFYEHPPLVFGLLSIFFKIFGDFFWVEKLYAILIAISTGYFIYKIWLLVFQEKNEQTSFWLPILFWLITPIIHWSYCNNMLECTMGLFCIASIYLLMRFVQSKNFIILFFSSLLIVLGFLSKGFVALFPLAFFFIYFISFRNFDFKNLIFYTIILWSFFGFIMLLILSYEPAFNALNNYFEVQVLAGIEGKREIASHRFKIIEAVFSELFPVFVLILILFCIAYFQKIKFKSPKKNWVLFFILIGFSASLPILVSAKQLSFYAVPSLVYFCIALAIFILPIANQIITKYHLKYSFKWIYYLFFIAIFIGSIFIFGQNGRDFDLQNEVEIIAEKIPKKSELKICDELKDKWGYHAYFYRIGFISLYEKANSNYILSENCQKVPEEFELQNWGLKKFKIYKNRSKNP